MSPETEPLFILSCHRSGSTLLRFAMDTHPEIYAPPELFLGNAASSLATFLAGLNGQVFEADKCDSRDFEEILVQTREILSSQMSSHTIRRGKRLWCEKTPDNLDHLNVIRALFPEAKYLCLYRHCLDVVKSAVEISERIPSLLPFQYASRGHLVTALIRYWTEWNGRLMRFEASHPGSCHRVHYEDLVADPAKAFGGMFSFLGLAWDQGLVDAIFVSQHDSGMEDFKVRSRKQIHQDSVGAGRDLSLAGVPEKMLQSMREMLALLGYCELPGQRAAGAKVERVPAVAWLFDRYLPERLRAEPVLAGWSGGSCRFAITGDGGGDWLIDFRGDGARVLSGAFPAACTITLAAADLEDLVAGRLLPLAAVRDGRLRIEGAVPMDALMRLLEIFLRANRVTG